VNKFISIRFFEQATEHDVEIPQPSDHPDFWQHAQDGEYQFLSSKGRAAMREMIRTEKDRQFEDWAKYAKTFAPIIAALAGLLGVLTGLVSVLRNENSHSTVTVSHFARLSDFLRLRYPFELLLIGMTSSRCAEAVRARIRVLNLKPALPAISDAPSTALSVRPLRA